MNLPRDFHRVMAGAISLQCSEVGHAITTHMGQRMPLQDLSPEDRDLVRRCVAAAANGPFIPDWEFRTLLGVDRDVARMVAATWPPNDEFARNVFLTINNSLNNLVGYPHGMNDVLSRMVGAPAEKIESVFEQWRAGHPPISRDVP